MLSALERVSPCSRVGGSGIVEDSSVYSGIPEVIVW